MDVSEPTVMNELECGATAAKRRRPFASLTWARFGRNLAWVFGSMLVATAAYTGPASYGSFTWEPDPTGFAWFAEAVPVSLLLVAFCLAATLLIAGAKGRSEKMSAWDMFLSGVAYFAGVAFFVAWVCGMAFAVLAHDWFVTAENGETAIFATEGETAGVGWFLVTPLAVAVVVSLVLTVRFMVQMDRVQRRAVSVTPQR